MQLKLFICFICCLVKIHSDCADSGPCVPCNIEELDEVFCIDSGMKMQQTCTSDEGIEIDDFRPCHVPVDESDNDDIGKVIIFQVLMAILGGLSYWGVQIRKRANMTLYDYRKARETGRL